MNYLIGQLFKLMALVTLVWLSLLLLLSAIGLVIAALEGEEIPSASLMRVLASVALFVVWAIWLTLLSHFWYLRVMRLRRS
ncbi:MAG: hypothetical protein NZ988_03745 [Thaumarchaeota archaeon]|nr:hypothetical protein [Candidatus Calditenuaceae archaeon]MDW8187143.1 hypothetical protein [Nitrososphaerota archaeon]